MSGERCRGRASATMATAPTRSSLSHMSSLPPQKAVTTLRGSRHGRLEPAPRSSDGQMDCAPTHNEQIPEDWHRLFALREDSLPGYGYETAPACWGDLQNIFERAVARDRDVLALSDKDTRQHLAFLKRRKYSERTTRRRRLVYSEPQTDIQMRPCRASHPSMKSRELER